MREGRKIAKGFRGGEGYWYATLTEQNSKQYYKREGGERDSYVVCLYLFPFFFFYNTVHTYTHRK